MKPNSRKRPQLGFKRFDESWEKKKLGELINERKEIAPQSINYPLVSFTAESGVTPKTNRYDREQLVVGNAKKKMYKVTYLNDIVYNPANLKFGAINRNKYGKAVFSPIYVTFRVNTDIVSARFVERLVVRKDFIKRTLKYQQGTVYERMSVSPRDLINLNVRIPSNREQLCVGNFFDKLDELIALRQHQLDQLKALKKGYLQKMFPRNDAKVPELRFKGFADDWEQCKLGTIVQVNSGKDYKQLKSGSIPVYGTGGYMLSVDKALSASQDAVGIGRKGTIDKPYILQAPFWTVDTLFYSIPKDHRNLHFIFALFEKTNWKKLDESTGVPSLSKSAINSVLVFEPSRAEQERIGTLFFNLDSLITLNQHKLDKLKELKKAYLQKMFC